MAETQKSCVICGGEESNGELLIEAPCGRHWVCPDDVSSFFERATQTESLFPPKCCGQMFMLQDFEDYVPFDIAWAFQVKEKGEYAVLAKYRVYCSNPSCAKFLHPSAHVTDPDTNITYAICEDEACGKLTCTGCKTLLDHGTQDHVCKKTEDEEKFKQTATEKGYQECNVCGATVELAEACNHITCECGHDFCYICGNDWIGMHGCPHYGPAIYDAEGYNQNGYHRDTGLNREGLTRRQDVARRRGEDPNDVDEEDDDDDDDDNEGEEDPDWEVLQHLAPDQRITINTLHGEAREDALDQLRIMLFETQGILFGQVAAPPVPVPQLNPGDVDEHNQVGEEGEEDAQGDGQAGNVSPAPAALINWGDDDEREDEGSDENESEVDAQDDGDLFIDEEGIQGDRLADDQSEEDQPVAHPSLNRFAPALDEWNASNAGSNDQDEDAVRASVAFFQDLGSETTRELQGDTSGAPHAGSYSELDMDRVDADLERIFGSRSTGGDSDAPHAGSYSQPDINDVDARLERIFGGRSTASDANSPATEPEDRRPATPMDLGPLPEMTDEQAEAVVKDGKRRLWGPPGGWPEEDDGEL